MDIMEPSQNTSTEQKQSSYQGLMRQRARRRKMKVNIIEKSHFRTFQGSEAEFVGKVFKFIVF